VRGRQDILELYLQDKPVGNDVDINAIAHSTPGFNGAGMCIFACFIIIQKVLLPGFLVRDVKTFLLISV
jgi:ATP-dependent 26S proteasome regulatory subunit